LTTYGRFNTPDRYQSNAPQKDSATWNRYSYAQGDPVNLRDPSGTFTCYDCGEGPLSCKVGSHWDAFDEQCRPDFTPPVNDGDDSHPPPPPQCTVTLGAQSAGFRLDPFDHTFLKIDKGGGTYNYLEGIPIPKDPQHSNLLFDPLWLNKSNGTTKSYYDMAIDFTRSLTTTTAICDTLVSFVSNYKKNSITYNNSSPFAGPNSNSFTHSLLNSAGLTVPWYWGDLYALAPGWNYTSVPFK
jgi:hypothetical protein